jgi:hypothetical protein
MAYTDLPPIPMNRGNVPAGDPRWRNSKVTAFFETKNPKVGTYAPATLWKVIVRTGDIADHHTFDTRLEAEHFALTVDPGYVLPAPETE